MFDFSPFVRKLGYVKDWDSFWWFFNAITPLQQFVVGAAIFGCLVLVYIFFVAIFIDKHL